MAKERVFHVKRKAKKSEKMGWWKGQDVKMLDGKTEIHVDTVLDMLARFFEPLIASGLDPAELRKAA